MKSLDNLLLSKLLLHIPADYSWSDAGGVRIGAAKDIATSSISLARSMFRCLLTSFKGDDGKMDMPCMIFGHKERISGKEGAVARFLQMYVGRTDS